MNGNSNQLDKLNSHICLKQVLLCLIIALSKFIWHRNLWLIMLLSKMLMLLAFNMKAIIAIT